MRCAILESRPLARAHLARAMTDAWLLEDEAPDVEEVREVLEEDDANVEGN